MYICKSSIKIFSGDDKRAFFGKGPYLLLCEVDKQNSLSKAAKNMNMAYSKAFRIIKEAQNTLGFDLIKTKAGGKNGGGSVLTEKAIKLIEAYRFVEKEINCKTKELYEEHIAPIIE